MFRSSRDVIVRVKHFICSACIKMMKTSSILLVLFWIIDMRDIMLLNEPKENRYFVGDLDDMLQDFLNSPLFIS